MSQYTLNYFPARSVGETSRLIFHYAGVEFKDNRITADEWAKLKPTTRYGKMPFLEVDGKILYESAAIARFLGKRYGLAGKDEWEEAKVNEVVDYFKDFYRDFTGFTYVVAGHLKGTKEEALKSVAEPAAKLHFPHLVKVLEDNGTGFLVGKDVTIADFFVSDFLFTLQGMAPQLFKDFPKLTEYVKKIHSIPQLQKYLSTRPNPVL